jgi:tRNA A-37 threonylcarbamoyl transferase component Bud32
MTQPHDPIDQPGLNGDRQPDEVAPSGSAAAIAGILDHYLADLQAGEAPDRDRLLADHPDLAAELEACLAGIEFVHRATGRAAPETPATLGEFRIIRELGRGGMGVVYEAEQTSLRRRVALKVLRFGAVADEEAMHRFHREAETVARLHHTNIVPIFAIGSERGVHYYAMQLIQGRSLADVLAESQRAGKPLPSEDIARWGLQAAEALAHAHQRGVIHRDIKPSNLLLDTEGLVWLTDFGLAKCADEVTLTLCGMLMGTPRYMSPEQAESIRRPIDHRTDVYSLGASLYELATGRPVFDATAPMGVIAQILNDDPARPRQIRPDLPRDLETVILTCLAKEPVRRYQSALALASDLRAVLEGRPIQARRAPWRERAVRYVRQRRKTLTGAGLATAATVVLMLGALGGWHYYSEWRLGRIVLTTDGPPLAAEVLPASAGDQPMGEPFDVGARTVLTLPAGDYRLRVKAAGRMSQTYRIAVNRGETRTHHVRLDDDRLLGTESIPFSLVTEAVMLTPGKTDLIEWNGETLIRRDGPTGKPVWDAARPERPRGRDRDPVAAIRRLSRFGDEKRPGRLVQPAPDVDGDGTRDLVWALRGTPSLVAVSGKDGSLLWTYSADPGAAVPRPAGEDLRPGQIMGTAAVTDVDGDGAADLIAEFVILEEPDGLIRRPREPAGRNEEAEPVLAACRMVVAVSGRSGKPLWDDLIDRKAADLPAEALDHGISYISQAKGSFLAVIDGSKWIGLDPTTGRHRGPSIELGFAPILPIQYADLDGDGSAEVLALGPNINFEPLTAPKLEAFSVTSGQRIWAKNLMSFFRPMPAVLARDWPVAADLDGDGRAEIVVPHLGQVGQGVRMLDGATGETRWECPLWHGMNFAHDSLVHLLAGPDLDADGTSDLVVVSRLMNPNQASAGQMLRQTWAYVDAVSGKDGRRLWHWRTDINSWDTTPSGPVFWWGRGSDGWPMLAVPIGGDLAPGVAAPRFFPSSAPDPPVVHFLAAATGQEEHTIAGLSWPRTADLDGDGLPDLWGSVDGKLCAFRGGPPEAWRVLDRLHAAGDFDGDGVTDVLSNDLETLRTGLAETMDSRTVIARSGRDGRILWRTLFDPRDDWVYPWGWKRAYGFHSAPLPGGDLDGDGAPEVVVVKRADAGPEGARGPVTLPVQVLSGRSGRQLWSPGPLPPLGYDASGPSHVREIDVRACEGQGPADVLVVHETPWPPGAGSMPPGSHYEQTRMARLSGRDGRVVWDVLLAEHKGGFVRLMDFERAFGDLDGDGGLDVVLRTYAPSTPGPTSFELRGLSLRDGKTLWTHPLRDANRDAKDGFTIGDLDGDGRDEVVVRDHPPFGTQAAVEFAALDGRDGTARWVWRGGDIDVPYRSIGPSHLADFDGKGRHDVCLEVGERVVILDGQGRERAGREPATKRGTIAACADLDGDGRDELLVQGDDRLSACRGDLSDIWSRPTRERVEQVVPSQSGRPATVVLASMLALDGAKGQTLWKGRPGRAIDAGPSAKPPRGLTVDHDATICTLVLPTTPDGGFEPAQGTPAPPGLTRDDPRWMRPLPWSRPSAGLLPDQFLVLVLGGLALINLVVPLLILKLATRRRVWSVRMLLALPAVVAIPMTSFLTFVSAAPPMAHASAGEAIAYFGLDTLGGIPIVVYVALVGESLIRRRRRRLVKLAVLSVLATAVLAGFWLLEDGLAKPTIEHYTWSDWHAVVVPGLYLAGVLIMVAWLVRGAWRFVWKRWRRRRAVAMNPS